MVSERISVLCLCCYSRKNKVSPQEKVVSFENTVTVSYCEPLSTVESTNDLSATNNQNNNDETSDNINIDNTEKVLLINTH